MKLEDLTKDELIWFIRNNYICGMNERSIVKKCLWNRVENQKKCNHELKNLLYCCDDDHGIHREYVKNEKFETLVLKYCEKCGAVFVVKNKKE